MESFLREKRKKNAILRSKELGLRRRLVKEWELLTEEQKVVTRSLRSKKGIKCEKCGCVGYFTEICPNNCYEPPPKEEVSHFGLERFGSDDEAITPIQKDQGEGFYWTNIDNSSEIEKPKRSYYPTKPDLTCLKEKTFDEKDRLRESDKKLTDYEFHRHAEEGYSQNLSELSLHQALRYFMRILEREIQENVKNLESKEDRTLFHPPSEIFTSQFYPKELEKIKEYREYFHQHAMKKDRQIHAHQHNGAIRPEDAMSVYFRDSGSLKKVDSTLSLYEPNAKAGQSIHGKIGWKSILAKNDELAISDPKMAEKLEELTKLESQQSAWTAQQKKSFEYQNERFQHMWWIIKQEIMNEHDRERRLLTVDAQANKRETEVAIWKERIDAADRLIETLRGYGYLRGTNEADYIIKGIEKWRAELANSRKRLQESGVLATHDLKKKKKKKKLKKKENGGSHLVSSLIKMRAKTREEDRRERYGQASDHDDTDNSDNETNGIDGNGKKTHEDDDSVSIHSMRKIATAAKASHLLVSSTPTNTQGGYHGLGLLSTFGASEIVAPVESSTSIASQLLMKGSMGLVSSESASVSTKTTSSVSSTKKKVGSTIMARKKLEAKEMELLAARYTDVGLQRNIRQGTSEDISTLAPALIPFHEVLANRLPPEEIPKSIAGQNAIIEARKRDANPITGVLTPKYLPLYVRSTLFEVNGTTPGGDQTYARMSHDRRYSHQLGRTMASLEPLPIKHKKVLQKTEEEPVKKGAKIRLF